MSDFQKARDEAATPAARDTTFDNVTPESVWLRIGNCEAPGRFRVVLEVNKIDKVLYDSIDECDGNISHHINLTWLVNLCSDRAKAFMQAEVERLERELAEAKAALTFDVDSNSATGWMVKYQRMEKEVERLEAKLAKRQGEPNVYSKPSTINHGEPASAEAREWKDGWQNCPAHAHEKPGIWDWDNGDKAGKICEQCFRWNAYDALKHELEALKTERPTSRGAEIMKELMAERDRWKAQAEKLAGALEIIRENGEIAPPNADTHVARLALAEYERAKGDGK